METRMGKKWKSVALVEARENGSLDWGMTVVKSDPIYKIRKVESKKIFYLELFLMY